MKRPHSSRKSTFRKLLIGLGLAIALGLAASAMWGGPKTVSQQAASTPEARNTVRREALKQLADAFRHYIAEIGPLPVKISATQTGICSGSSAHCKKAGLIDPIFLVSAGFLVSAPNDPVGGHVLYSTGYTVGKNAEGKFVLQAPRAENGASISQVIE